MFDKKKLVIFYILCLIIVIILIFGLTSCRTLNESEKQELDTKELIVYNHTKNKELLKTRCYKIYAEDNYVYLEIYAYIEKENYQYYLVYKHGDDIRYTFG